MAVSGRVPVFFTLLGIAAHGMAVHSGPVSSIPLFSNSLDGMVPTVEADLLAKHRWLLAPEVSIKG